MIRDRTTGLLASLILLFLLLRGGSMPAAPVMGVDAAALLRTRAASAPASEPRPRVAVAAAPSATPATTPGAKGKKGTKAPAVAPPPATTPLPAEFAETFLDDESCDDQVARGVESHFVPEWPGRVQWMIATVPDPIDAHDGWTFDGRIDGLERALENAGYRLDQYWLPWECIRRAGDEAKQAAMRRRVADRFGVLRFHRRGPDRILVVLLVGETPTSGVNVQAFARAMRTIDRNPTAGSKVRVLGPSYSGSTDSLAIAFSRAAYAWPLRRFDVVTGSATSVDARRLERDARPARVRFSATVLSDAVLRRVLCRYLDSYAGMNGVVTLVESTTEYGRTYGSASATGTRCTPNLEIPFPMQISQIRDAYERDASLKDRRPEDPNSPRRSLEVSLEDDPGTAHDVVPSQGPRMTAASNEMVLGNLLSTAARSGVQWVGLVATDTRDKIFLARKVREQAPNVRLFTYEADLLYARSEFRTYMEGGVIASSYPLTPALQMLSRRTSDNRTVLGFATQAAEGTYNAALMLLRAGRFAVDYGDPFAADQGQGRPRAWITAIGHEGLWPIDAFDPGEDGYTRSLPRAPNVVRESPLSFPSVPGVILILGAVACVACALFVGGGRRAPSVGEVRARWAIFGLLLATTAAQAIACITESVAMATIRAPVDSTAVPPDLAVKIAVVLIVGATLLAAPRGVLAAFGILAVLTGLLGPGRDVLVAAIRERAGHALLALERSTDLASGLSVGVPATCMVGVLLLWAWTIETRERLRSTGRARNPLGLEGATVGGEGIRALDGAAEGWFRGPRRRMRRWKHHAFVFPVVLLVAATVYRAVGERLRVGAGLTLEGWRFDVPFLVLAGIAYTIVVIEALRTIAIWLDLRALLRALTFHPLLASYGRLSQRMKRTLRTNFYGYIPKVADFRPGVTRWYVLLSKLADVRAELRDTYRIPDDQLQHLQDLEVKAGKLQELFAECLAIEVNEHVTVTTRLQAAFAARALALLPIMSCIWKTQFETPTIPASSPKPPDLSPKPSAERWLEMAQEFIAVQVVVSVAYKCQQLRNVGVFILSASLLLLLAASSYSFQPQGALTTVASTTTVGVVGILVWVFIQMERDELLSEASGTDGHRVTLDQTFVTRLLTYGVLPITTVIATQFPQVGQFVSTLLRLSR